MRLYRGLKQPYRQDAVGAGSGRIFGTNFTDCPFAALRYAQGPRAVVLVLDVADGQLRVSEEHWPDADAKRLMLWGKFDHLIVAEIPAKELRAHVRRKGVVTSSDSHKASVLDRAIHEWIATAGA